MVIDFKFLVSFLIIELIKLFEFFDCLNIMVNFNVTYKIRYNFIKCFVILVVFKKIKY